MTNEPAVDGERDAFGFALRALRHRDRTEAEIDQRLEHAGVGLEERARVLARLRAAGYLDDARFAERRAESLATRGAGDEVIVRDLCSHGVAAEHAAAIVAALEPEAARAAAIVVKRGRSPRTFRYLAGRGFSEESLDGFRGS